MFCTLAGQHPLSFSLDMLGLSVVIWLFPAPWTVVHQTTPPMEFSRQEYWGRVSFLTLFLWIIDPNFHKELFCSIEQSWVEVSIMVPFSTINSGWQKTPLLSSAMLDPLQEILVVLDRCPPGLSQDRVSSGFLALHSLSILECPCLWVLWYLPLPFLPYLWLKFPEMLHRNFFFHILLWIGS